MSNTTVKLNPNHIFIFSMKGYIDPECDAKEARRLIDKHSGKGKKVSVVDETTTETVFQD